MAFVEDISESHEKHSTLYAGRTYVTQMQLAPGENIGMEKHKVEQITYIIEGTGVASFPDTAELETIQAGSIVVVPEDTHHDISNTGKVRMKLMTVYSGDPHPNKREFAKKVLLEDPELYGSVVDIIDDLPVFSRTNDPWKQLYSEYVSLMAALSSKWNDVLTFAQDGRREATVTTETLKSFETNYPLLTFLYARDNPQFAEALRDTEQSRVDDIAASLGLQF